MLDDGDARAAHAPSVPAVPALSAPPRGPAGGVPLARLTARTCRWPLWPDHVRPTPEAARYCGGDVVAGGSYCPCHAERGGQRAAPISGAVLRVAHTGTAVAPRVADDVPFVDEDGASDTPRVRAPAPPVPVAPRPAPVAVEPPSVFLARYAEVAARLKSTWHRPQAVERPAPAAPVVSAVDLADVADAPPAPVTADAPCAALPAPAMDAAPSVLAPADLPLSAVPRPLAAGGKYVKRAGKAGVRAAEDGSADKPERLRSVAEAVGARMAGCTDGMLPVAAAPTPSEIPAADPPLIDGGLPPPPKVIRLAAIINLVCARYEISRVDLVSHRARRVLVEARHVVMWLARTYTTHSYPVIGRALGNRDHTTVMYGVYKIEAQRALDARLAGVLAALATELMVQP